MDYEKEYKEALKRAKEINNEHRTQPFDVMTRVFHELAESEDERIRKWCISFIKTTCDYDSPTSRKEVDDAIAWLEKQGEHTKFRDSIQVGDKVTRNQDGMLVNLSQLKRVAKPADKVEPKFKVKYAGSEYNVFETKDIAGVTFYGIEDEPNHIDYVKAENCKVISGYAIKENGSPYPTKPAVFSEQNPAWSEEDEENLRKARFYVNYYQTHEADSAAAELCDNWLKSLRDRYCSSAQT